MTNGPIIEMIPLRKCGGHNSARKRRSAPGDPAPADISYYGPAAMPLRREGPRRRHQGLGEGLPTASGITAAGGGIAASLIGAKVFGAAAASGPLAPLVLAGTAVVALLLKFFGGGCGDACVDASKIEQIYEAAALDLEEVGKLGMISREEAAQGMQMFIRAGQQHEAQLNDEHAQEGAANLTKVIEQIIARSQSLSSEAKNPLDLDAARAAYISTSKTLGKEWYPDSLSAAAEMASQYLSSLAASPLRQASQAAGRVESALKSAGIPPALALVALGIAVWWVWE